MQEKKKFQSSFDNSFLKESKSGNQAIDLFLDRANPYNKVDQYDNYHHAELRFVATVTTGGRVKLGPAVSIAGV